MCPTPSLLGVMVVRGLGLPALPVSSRSVCFVFQCKHLLAVYLSQVMGTCQQLSVSDKQLTDILMEKKQEA